MRPGYRDINSALIERIILKEFRDVEFKEFTLKVNLSDTGKRGPRRRYVFSLGCWNKDPCSTRDMKYSLITSFADPEKLVSIMQNIRVNTMAKLPKSKVSFRDNFATIIVSTLLPVNV